MMAMTRAPRLIWPSSSPLGRRTFNRTSAPATSAAERLRARPLQNRRRRRRRQARPRAGPANSAPSARNFFAVSALAATRVSAGSVSATMPIRMDDPREARAPLAVDALEDGPGYRERCRPVRPAGTPATRRASSDRSSADGSPAMTVRMKPIKRDETMPLERPTAAEAGRWSPGRRPKASVSLRKAA